MIVNVEAIEQESFRECVLCHRSKLYLKVIRKDSHHSAIGGEGQYWRGKWCAKCHRIFKAGLAQRSRDNRKLNQALEA